MPVASMAELPPRAMAGASWRSSCYGCHSGPVNGLQRPRLVKNFVLLVRVLLHCADAQVLGLSGLLLGVFIIMAVCVLAVLFLTVILLRVPQRPRQRAAAAPAWCSSSWRATSAVLCRLFVGLFVLLFMVLIVSCL